MEYGTAAVIRLVECQNIVSEPPDFPRNIEVLKRESRYIKLGWTSSQDGNSPITKYIIEYKTDSGNYSLDPLFGVFIASSIVFVISQKSGMITRLIPMYPAVRHSVTSTAFDQQLHISFGYLPRTNWVVVKRAM